MTDLVGAPCQSFFLKPVIFPFLKPDDLVSLKNEYLAAAEDVTLEYSPVDFWINNAVTLLAWAEAAKRVLLVQPSSAAAE